MPRSALNFSGLQSPAWEMSRGSQRSIKVFGRNNYKLLSGISIKKLSQWEGIVGRGWLSQVNEGRLEAVISWADHGLSCR
jgi:hypothetical protein